MKKLLLALTLITFSVTSSIAQTKVGDATLPNSMQYNEQSLILNGAGLREKLWFDLYACGLYLPQKSSNASSIVASDELMAVKIHILSSLVSKKKLIEAFRKGIDETNNVSDVKRLKSKIDVFLTLIKNDIAVDNVYDLVYFPNKGVTVYENNKDLGTIEGLDFKKLLFNVWLAPSPVDDDLKDEMLKS